MFKNRSRIMTTIWATLPLAACLGLWCILPAGIRNEVEPTAEAATLTVNSADDHNDGVCNAADCTLREAIIAANAGDTISFNIPGPGVHPINATSGYSITKALTIDGATQPGFAGVPLIELNGAGAGAGANGFAVNAPNVIIRGFIINRFPAYAISFDSFGNDTVQSCYIGTNAAGTAASANLAGGIRINSPNITIGGITSGAGNVISGNTGNGIDILVGNATIGGTSIGAGNVISGNYSAGVVVLGGSAISILGNLIGQNAAATDSIPNVVGVGISSGSAKIGGTEPGSRNIISGNGVSEIEK